MPRDNILLVTADQLTARALTGPLGALVPTPNLDRLAAQSVSFARHYTVAVPCGPARASLLTGLYAMNHRAIRNGTPLARHHATVATEARRAGYEPLLFGYTDTAADPTDRDPEDPDLFTYEGVAPGFRELVEMRAETGHEWPGYLWEKGYRPAPGSEGGPIPWHQRPQSPPGRAPRPSDPAIYAAEHSDTAYLTDRTLTALEMRKGRGWFAHVSYLRPHPPLVAPEPWNRLIDPAKVPLPVRERPRHPWLDAWFASPAATGLFWGFDGDCANMPDELMRECIAVYLGLVAELDHHLGRLLDWLETSGEAERTFVIFTADHGETLGAHSMWGKESPFEGAWHVPLMIRDPQRPGQGGRVVEQFTESVDVAPTILARIGLVPPPAMDGRPLLPFLEGVEPEGWRDAVMGEMDYGHPGRPSRLQAALGLGPNETSVTIWREARWKYVRFGGGLPPLLFDLETDPDETRNLADDAALAAEMHRLAGRIIDRMCERRDRRLTGYSSGQ